jgi:dTDP-4-dehydrorhamnose reductase
VTFKPLRRQLDVSDFDRLTQYIEALQPDYLINCTGFTAVDLAEDEVDAAYLMNAKLPSLLADCCQKNRIKFIHFSTDYVFNGNGEKPYTVHEPTSPINQYGLSKRAGEAEIQQKGGDYLILRTAWLYAPWGKNFFNFIRRSDAKGIQIVDSQIGSPTSALSLADFVVHILNSGQWQTGIYHFTNKDAMSWFAFAKAIKSSLNLNVALQPVAEYATKAARPAYSVLDTAATETDFDYTIASFEQALTEIVDWKD